MARIAQIFSHVDLEKSQKYVSSGGRLFPKHHFWGFDHISNSGHDAHFVKFDKKDYLTRLGARFQVGNLRQQLNCLKESKDFDLIYDPFLKFSFVLALLKVLKLYNKPILAIAHQSYRPFKKNPLKRLKQKMVKYIYYHGIDYLLFSNENLYKENPEHKHMENVSYISSWGPEVDFFASFAENQKELPQQKYVYATGGSGRDFRILVNAIEELDFPLKITTRKPAAPWMTSLGGKIEINSTITPGLESTGIIRKDYYDALCVAIPLTRHKQPHIHNNGSTVLFEALAMGKPVVMTQNEAFPFDMEKEKVGFAIDYNDVNGWIEALRYFIENPGIAQEMGARGKYLCEKKYNYSNFGQELRQHFNYATNSVPKRFKSKMVPVHHLN